MGTPARGYTNTHPPFEPGNFVARRHGAYSGRCVEQQVATMVESGELPTVAQVADALGWVQPGDVWAIEAWQRAEARRVLVEEWLTTNGLTDGDGGLRESVVRLLAQCEREAGVCRDRLGLDPTARARLAKDTAIARHFGPAAVADLAATGARSRELAEQRAALAAVTDEEGDR